MRDSIAPMRQQFQMEFVLTGEELAVALGLIRANPLGDWYLPAWTDAATPADVASAATTISCDTDGDYAVGESIVIWQDRSNYAIREVGSVGSGSIGITASAGADYTAAIVAPVKTAFAASGMDYQRVYHDLVRATMSFTVRSATQFSSNPFSAYDGFPVVTDLSFAKSPIAGRISQAAEYVDDGIGNASLVALRSVLDGVYGLNFEDDTQALRKRRRQWLGAVRGRDNPFWLPSRSREMRLASPVASAATTLPVVPIYATAAEYVGKHLCIGTDIYREVTAAVVNGANHDLTIAAPGRDLTDPEICVLELYRLDADQIEIAHQSNFRAFGQVAIREVPA